MRDPVIYERTASRRPRGVRLFVGYLGVMVALPVFIWLLIGLVPAVPSMVDVFGIPGLRWPASVAVAGLLMAAIGFWED